MTDTEAFFLDSGSDQLAKIYHWARARYAAPWAVFFAVLLRVAASVGAHVQLPGTIGGRASLNLMCAFVSASGGGKGISDKVGRLAWPTPILELPIGSGEGIAATFKKPDKPDADNEPITAAIFSIPEIDTLAGIAARQGSILLAQLKSMAMGEQLGQSNASKATSRVVAAHSYRCCLSVGAQPGHTGVIFNDTTGGTPQRFLWSPTTDPGMPATASPDPDPLDTALPLWCPGEDGVVEITYGVPEIAEAVIAAHIARQRGEADPLDGHWMLTRLKVAALLAIMHHRSVVSQADWEMSAGVMAVSDATREWIVNEARKAEREKVRARAIARAVGDEVYDRRLLDSVKRSIVRMLDHDGEQAGNELRSRLGKREKRDLFDQAVSELAADGYVESLAVDRGTRYRLLRSGQGDQPGQGRYPHVGEGDHIGQGDQSNNITALDSRRSHQSERPKLSCQKWFNNHIAELRAAGHTTAESFAVYRAGMNAGYTRGSLGQAASAHPDIVTVNRTSRGATWSLLGDHESAYRPATDFFASYLATLPAGSTEIDQTDYRRAATAAGYSWDAALKAATGHPRVESQRARGLSKNERVWLLRSDGEAS
ncbi:hypothetical protein [Mycobacterium interjectum]|uniref:hypothetical protein n=1 Tax=Mycobacterium interjectum TaxID=33895 RepID=UPI000833ECB5|nr:hypothetical protein [Mycobacterium interjectum]MCV7091765.1 hypothetical protein [Mycobacterium interjectum]